MELLDLKRFKKAYPHLSKKMYRVLNIEYPENIKVPIDMEDASLADTFFANGKKISLGRAKAKMIMNLIKTRPDFEQWLDILYPDRIIIKKQPYKRKDKIIKKEIILYVYKKKNGYICRDNNGKNYTDKINNQPKLNYAYKNDGVIRGRILDGESEYKYRAVKRKFVERRETMEDIENRMH